MLTIGILNSMPEAAVRSTERQFGELLTEAAGLDIPLRLKWFSLQPRDGYGSSHDLWATRHLDGLIATGTEPRAAYLNEEPYWDAFTRTVEWATTHTTSAVWSCLGAHAAVLYLDNVQRSRFATETPWRVRRSSNRASIRYWQIPRRLGVCRIRDGMICRCRLCYHVGYRLLTERAEAGADLFVKTCGTSLFVFFQGHPEYDARALMREYRRDVLRFLTGERSDYPGLPAHYFDLVTERQLRTLRTRAMTGQQSRYQHGGFPIPGGQSRSWQRPGSQPPCSYTATGSTMLIAQRARQLVACRAVNPLFPSCRHPSVDR